LAQVGENPPDSLPASVWGTERMLMARASKVLISFPSARGSYRNRVLKDGRGIVNFITYVYRLHRANLAARLCCVKQFVLGISLAAIAASSLAQQSIHRYASLYHPAQSQHGMVVSQRHGASKIGAGVLSHCGNAMDAAVAV